MKMELTPLDIKPLTPSEKASYMQKTDGLNKVVSWIEVHYRVGKKPKRYAVGYKVCSLYAILPDDTIKIFRDTAAGVINANRTKKFLFRRLPVAFNVFGSYGVVNNLTYEEACAIFSEWARIVTALNI